MSKPYKPEDRSINTEEENSSTASFSDEDENEFLSGDFDVKSEASDEGRNENELFEDDELTIYSDTSDQGDGPDNDDSDNYSLGSLPPRDNPNDEDWEELGSEVSAQDRDNDDRSETSEESDYEARKSSLSEFDDGSDTSERRDSNIKNLPLSKSAATTKIQKLWRGYQVRKKLGTLIEEEIDPETPISPSEDPDAPVTADIDKEWPKRVNRLRDLKPLGVDVDLLNDAITGDYFNKTKLDKDKKRIVIDGKADLDDRGLLWYENGMAVAQYKGLNGFRQFSEQTNQVIWNEGDPEIKTSFVKIEDVVFEKGTKPKEYYAIISASKAAVTKSFVSKQVFEEEVEEVAQTQYNRALATLWKINRIDEIQKVLEVLEKDPSKNPDKLSYVESIRSQIGLITEAKTFFGDLKKARVEEKDNQILRKILDINSLSLIKILGDIQEKHYPADPENKEKLGKLIKSFSEKNLDEKTKEKARNYSASSVNQEVGKKIQGKEPRAEKIKNQDLEKKLVSAADRIFSRDEKEKNEYKKLADTPVYNSKISGLHIQESSRQNLATVLFQGESHKSAYVSLPGTGFYVEVIRFNEEGVGYARDENGNSKEIEGEPGSIMITENKLLYLDKSGKARSVSTESQNLISSTPIQKALEEMGQHPKKSAGILEQYKNFQIKAVSQVEGKTDIATLFKGKVIGGTQEKPSPSPKPGEAERVSSSGRGATI